jgi:cell division septal protein FtsQ
MALSRIPTARRGRDRRRRKRRRSSSLLRRLGRVLLLLLMHLVLVWVAVTHYTNDQREMVSDLLTR